MTRIHVAAEDVDAVLAHLMRAVGLGAVTWADLPDGSKIMAFTPTGSGDRAHALSHEKVFALPDPLSPRPLDPAVLARFPHVKGRSIITAYDLFEALHAFKLTKSHASHPMLDPEMRS